MVLGRLTFSCIIYKLNYLFAVSAERWWKIHCINFTSAAVDQTKSLNSDFSLSFKLITKRELNVSTGGTSREDAEVMEVCHKRFFYDVKRKTSRFFSVLSRWAAIHCLWIRKIMKIVRFPLLTQFRIRDKYCDINLHSHNSAKSSRETRTAW